MTDTPTSTTTDTTVADVEATAVSAHRAIDEFHRVVEEVKTDAPHFLSTVEHLVGDLIGQIRDLVAGKPTLATLPGGLAAPSAPSAAAAVGEPAGAPPGEVPATEPLPAGSIEGTGIVPAGADQASSGSAQEGGGPPAEQTGETGGGAGA